MSILSISVHWRVVNYDLLRARSTRLGGRSRTAAPAGWRAVHPLLAVSRARAPSTQSSSHLCSNLPRTHRHILSSSLSLIPHQVRLHHSYCYIPTTRPILTIRLSSAERIPHTLSSYSTFHAYTLTPLTFIFYAAFYFIVYLFFFLLCLHTFKFQHKLKIEK